VVKKNEQGTFVVGKDFWKTKAQGAFYKSGYIQEEK